MSEGWASYLHEELFHHDDHISKDIMFILKKSMLKLNPIKFQWVYAYLFPCEQSVFNRCN
jgi:hypothetical protein